MNKNTHVALAAKVDDKGTHRAYPLGTLKSCKDGALHFSDGSFVPLADVLEGKVDVSLHQLVQEICDELFLTRKILKDVARQQRVRIDSNSEYHREMQSLAGKLGENSDDIKAIIEPMIRELFEDMFVSKTKKSKRQRRK